jgi:uncharacterized protein (TIGR02285 family)
MAKALMIAWLLLWSPCGLAAQGPQASPRGPLNVYYIHRPPYYMTLENGQAGGFLIAAARMILDDAALDHRVVPLPPKRILRFLRNSRYACSVGWFRTPEREGFALFSEPIYRNRPLGAVMRRSTAARLAQPPSMEQLLHSEMVFGVIDGFSYGNWADMRIRQADPRLHRVPNSPPGAAAHDPQGSGRLDPDGAGRGPVFNARGSGPGPGASDGASGRRPAGQPTAHHV